MGIRICDDDRFPKLTSGQGSVGSTRVRQGSLIFMNFGQSVSSKFEHGRVEDLKNIFGPWQPRPDSRETPTGEVQ